MDILGIRMDDIVGAMNFRVIIETRAIREIDKSVGRDLEQVPDAANRCWKRSSRNLLAGAFFQKGAAGHAKAGCSKMSCPS
jgi:hypothetical protein